MGCKLPHEQKQRNDDQIVVYGNPIISMMAEEGIRALASALPTVVEDPANMEARSEALYGAWLAGITLGSAGVALHHKG